MPARRHEIHNGASLYRHCCHSTQRKHRLFLDTSPLPTLNVNSLSFERANPGTYFRAVSALDLEHTRVSLSMLLLVQSVRLTFGNSISSIPVSFYASIPLLPHCSHPTSDMEWAQRLVWESRHK